MVEITWDSPASMLAGKGAKSKRQSTDTIQGSNWACVGDVLQTYPRTYVKKDGLSELGSLTEGSLLSLVGEIINCKPFTYRDRRSGKQAYRLEVRVRAEGGQLLLTYFDRNAHTASWRAKEMSPGRKGLFAGRLKWFRDEWQLTNPESRLYGANTEGDIVELPDLIPIYPQVGGLTTWQIEDVIRIALDLVDDFPDPLPAEIREREGLLDLRTAYSWIHRPDSWAQKTKAEDRIKYDEAWVAQVVLARKRLEVEATAANPRPGCQGGLLDAFDAQLPFELTDGQLAVGKEIGAELALDHPMHRLLQGEVGSGKTIVALRAMLQVVDSGGQAALLAPTDVLAQQHLRSMSAMLGDLAAAGMLGGAEVSTRLTLLTGSLGAKARRQALLDAASGEAGIVIGTHALLEEHVSFADLGLVVVDEQHRFGVEQRAALGVKADKPPHVLVMTATPIPRTVAMTVFGDLDTSTLSQLPAGRAEVQTNVVPLRAQPGWLPRVWERIREEVAKGRQAYVVCSRIDPTDDDTEGLWGVVELAEELREDQLHGLRVEVLHGRLPAETKDAVMLAFAAGEIDVLVSTTVIEVGVDVPNSSVMAIMDADRFGVSQLHQLRGRIGRGGHTGVCLLVTRAEPGTTTMQRLEAVAGSRDGFALSRIDLEQRREGDVLGTAQSGGSKSLKKLSVLNDEDIIVRASEAAAAYVRADPQLAGLPALSTAVAILEASQRADFMEMG
ncbi:MAG: ATP-dependent DNA helicase RecG [Marmoricola sp.]